MRNLAYTIGFHVLAIGVGWASHPGWGLALWGAGVCIPLAWANVLEWRRQQQSQAQRDKGEW